MKITQASVAIRKSFGGPSSPLEMIFEIRIGNEEKMISLSRPLDAAGYRDHLNVALALVDMARALEAL